MYEETPNMGAHNRFVNASGICRRTYEPDIWIITPFVCKVQGCGMGKAPGAKRRMRPREFTIEQGYLSISGISRALHVCVLSAGRA
jgi:hypothetical protein